MHFLLYKHVLLFPGLISPHSHSHTITPPLSLSIYIYIYILAYVLSHVVCLKEIRHFRFSPSRSEGIAPLCSLLTSPLYSLSLSMYMYIYIYLCICIHIAFLPSPRSPLPHSPFISLSLIYIYIYIHHNIYVSYHWQALNNQRRIYIYVCII
jgi:hypothetical protein